MFIFSNVFRGQRKVPEIVVAHYLLDERIRNFKYHTESVYARITLL